MSTRSEIIGAWLDKAAGDLTAARVLCAAPHHLADHAAYHCQQAAEKLIKAVLVARDIQPPKSHDLEHLTLLLPVDDPFRPLLAELVDLTPFATAWRYPSAPLFHQPSPDLSEVEGWTSRIQRVLDLVSARILPPAP